MSGLRPSPVLVIAAVWGHVCVLSQVKNDLSSYWQRLGDREVHGLSPGPRSNLRALSSLEWFCPDAGSEGAIGLVTCAPAKAVV